MHMWFFVHSFFYYEHCRLNVKNLALWNMNDHIITKVVCFGCRLYDQVSRLGDHLGSGRRGDGGGEEARSRRHADDEAEGERPDEFEPFR